MLFPESEEMLRALFNGDLGDTRVLGTCPKGVVEPVCGFENLADRSESLTLGLKETEEWGGGWVGVVVRVAARDLEGGVEVEVGFLGVS
jgi:hypothetical protein